MKLYSEKKEYRKDEERNYIQRRRNKGRTRKETIFRDEGIKEG
jgi:hypothetical protein